MPLNAWGRLYKLWNRESVVMNFGIYTYQLDDFIQSLTPKLNSIFGYDSSLKKATEFYEKNEKKKETNEYTNIFKGKNVIFIHFLRIQHQSVYPAQASAALLPETGPPQSASLAPG